MEQSSHLTWIGNIASAGAVVLSWAGLLPTIMTVTASAVALIWYAIQIYESVTITKWRQRRLRNRLVRMHREATDLELLLTDPADIAEVERVKEMARRRVDIDAHLAARLDPPGGL